MGNRADMGDAADTGRIDSDNDAAPPGTVESLVLDLLEWIGPGPRAYDEVLEAWRTSCPRLPVWEEAKAHGLIEVRPGERGRCVVVSAAGTQYLRRQRKVRLSTPP